ncbi:MAG: tRNA U-34 5-methylaminomethyl-2-thiouridine biosynthesis protein, partial [Hirschia sp.]|nr:tRNA U-34 5-methylaminomethyl-2-thiouridine biosynthesis protein [Hirschia sp.]
AHPPHPDAGLRLENIEGLKALAPAVAARIDDARLSSRTGVRATTPDRLPFVGRLPDEAAYLSLYGEDLEKGRSSSAPYCDAHLPGLMVAGGLGARGFTWAPLLADIAIALANGGPMPTGRASHETLSPARFIMRDCKRGVRRPRV